MFPCPFDGFLLLFFLFHALSPSLEIELSRFLGYNPFLGHVHEDFTLNTLFFLIQTPPNLFAVISGPPVFTFTLNFPVKSECSGPNSRWPSRPPESSFFPAVF